jgi:hypothetical protein
VDQLERTEQIRGEDGGRDYGQNKSGWEGGRMEGLGSGKGILNLGDGKEIRTAYRQSPQGPTRRDWNFVLFLF